MFLKQVFNHILEKWPLHGKCYVNTKFPVLVEILSTKTFFTFHSSEICTVPGPFKTLFVIPLRE